MKWTKPYYGVEHLGDWSPESWWATIEDHNTFVKLLRWFPKCQFHPHESFHDTILEAKQKGERWVKRGVLNRI